MENKFDPLTYPEVKPLNGVAKRLIVFLHGYGSDGQDLIGLVPFMQKELPDCHFISPNGLEEFELAPYGRQWFSLQDRSMPAMQKLMPSSASLLEEIIVEKQKQLDLTDKDTIIIGFSQGTMIGLYLTLMRDKPFAACVGFAGRLIPPPVCKNTKTPVCLIHGEADEVVPVSSVIEAVAYLKSYAIENESLSIANLAHSIDGKGIAYSIDFINKHTIK